MMIFGDYDVDGVSSVTILVKALRKLGVDLLWRVPVRLCEGYWIRPQAVIDSKEQGIHLIITVDNGIAELEAVDLARTSSMDLIVTDHHYIGHQLPNANALVHPTLGDYGRVEVTNGSSNDWSKKDCKCARSLRSIMAEKRDSCGKSQRKERRSRS
ncbi:hypothetical protein BM613_12750 [Sulfoacidibacillus thermotolerans]|uniref:DDH domain-containing protein n=1 Tax=Sulfoacidibacillus thermotolerans TaxID=1765684 RepID=A0A2U3D5M8_SULT2|nr:hypothetical protein BM613_12935 [Sulfoacidibacillus thermotolerans]PWI56643.1 hypothetical protein BM613_12750 [Sulfoacidibacillus thermotolerans]